GEVLGRMRSDPVIRKPVLVPWISPLHGCRPPKHGNEYRFAKPDTWRSPLPTLRKTTPNPTKSVIKMHAVDRG
ncbi:hypothetical protein AB0L67_41730, partial [Streptomyces flaveolus]